MTKVITKSKALKLFNSSEHDIFKLDNAKYKWLGSQRNHIEKFGKQLNDKYECANHIAAIWFERRIDNHGPYCQIMCLIDQQERKYY